jgi:hypothetical protein
MDHRKKIYLYKIPCTTDNTTHTRWAYSKPQTCPINAEHSIDADNIEIIAQCFDDEVSAQTFKSVSDADTFQRNFRTEMVSYTIPATTGTHTFDITFPYPIVVLAVKFSTTQEHLQDTVDVSIAPKTLIGATTQPLPDNTNEIYLPEQSIQHLSIGYQVHVGDQYLGDIRKIYANRVVTVQSLAQPVNVGTPVYFSVNIIRNYKLHYEGKHTIGDSRPGGSAIPEGSIIRLDYTNNSTPEGSIKSFNVIIEYLY